VLAAGGDTEVRLQRHVAEVFEAEHAELARRKQDLGHGQRDRAHQPRHRDERQRVHVDGARVQGQYDRSPIAEVHAEVAAVRGIARERDHAAPRGDAAIEIGLTARPPCPAQREHPLK
jgi:hypothetical protein